MGNMQFSDFDKEVLKKIEDLDKNTKEKLKKIADEWNLTMTKLQSETEMTSIEKLENEYKKLSKLLDKNIEVNNEWTNFKEKISRNENIDDSKKHIFYEAISKMQGFILLEIYKCSSDYNRIGNYISEKKREILEEKITEQKNRILIFEDNLKIQSNKLNENEKTIQEQNKKLKDNTDKINNHDKRILEIMGIFLSIFSIIGLGITGILNIKDNLPTNILLIMGSILIVITLLFALIKYDSKNKYKFWIIIIFGIDLILTGIFFYNPVDKNWEEAKIKIENLEKRLDYEKRINELENKTK